MIRDWIKKRYSDILFGILIVLLIIPDTRVYFLRIFSFSPGVENVEDAVVVEDYSWKLKGLNTDDFDFENARGQVVLVNFWATWCTPCVAEMPSLQALYKDYGDRVKFILVTTEDRERTLHFLQEKSFDMPVYHAIGHIPEYFQTSTIPRTFLIDKKGRILVNTGRADWNSAKVRRLLDKLLAE